MGEQNNSMGIDKNKRIILILLAILLLVRIGYIAIGEKIPNTFNTSYIYDLTEAYPVPCSNITESFSPTHNSLSSIELLFAEILDDFSGSVDLCILDDEVLLYQTNITLSNKDNMKWRTVFVNAPLQLGKEYRITINANDDCSKIPCVMVLNSGYAPEIRESFTDGNKMNDNVVLNFTYPQYTSRFDRVVTASLLVIFYIVVFFIIKKSEDILFAFKFVKGYLTASINETLFAFGLEFLLCLFVLKFAGIEFQTVTKLGLLGVSFIAVIDQKKKKSLVDLLFNSNWKRVLLYLLYIYASFALIGQRILIYPLAKKLSISGLIVLICCLIWFIPVVNSVIYYYEQLIKGSDKGKSKIKTWQFVLLNSLILILPATYNLYANNPGISSYDTWQSMVINAHNLVGMYDWHPAFYCMILRVIQMIWDSTYAVIVVQYFFWAYVMVEFFLYLRKKGISDLIIFASSLFCGLNIANVIHINTIWKDIPYALSLFWLFVIVAKLTLDFDEYKGKKYIYFELIVSLVGVFFYRKNGIVPFVVVSIVLIIFLRKNIKILISLAVSILLIVVIKGPIYSHFKVVDPGVNGMYHGLGLDILGVYFSDGEVSEDTMQMITMMTDYNNAEYLYNPTWSYQSYYVDVSPVAFVKNYLNTFFRNPITMLKAIICREDAMWDVFDGSGTMLGCVGYIGTMDGSQNWNDYYSKRVFTSIYPTMTAITEYSAHSQLIAAVIWRSGFFTLLGLICLVTLIVHCGKGLYIVIISPIIGQILSLLLSTGWADFRYYWPLNIMNFALLLLAIIIIRRKADSVKK